MQMTVGEFIQTHCQDIMAIKQVEMSNPFGDFKFDEIVDNDVPVIYDGDGREIPVEEIVGLEFKDFCKLYPHQSSAEAFRNYVSAYRIIQGEDLFKEHVTKMEQARARISKFSEHTDVNEILDL